MQKQIRKIVSNIDAHVSILDTEGELLYQLAKKSKGNVVEIGSWKGRSTIWLAKGVVASKKKFRFVFAVDPHENMEACDARLAGKSYGEFLKNITRAKVRQVVIPMVKTSANAVASWKEGIGLVFIDGSHTYEDVAFDLHEWGKFVKEGGYVALHDTIGYEGPKKVLMEALKYPSPWMLYSFEGQVAVLQKWPRSPYTNAAVNVAALLTKELYDLAFLMAKNRLPQSIKDKLKELL